MLSELKVVRDSLVKAGELNLAKEVSSMILRLAIQEVESTWLHLNARSEKSQSEFWELVDALIS